MTNKLDNLDKNWYKNTSVFIDDMANNKKSEKLVNSLKKANCPSKDLSQEGFNNKLLFSNCSCVLMDAFNSMKEYFFEKNKNDFSFTKEGLNLNKFYTNMFS